MKQYLELFGGLLRRAMTISDQNLRWLIQGGTYFDSNFWPEQFAVVAYHFILLLLALEHLLNNNRQSDVNSLLEAVGPTCQKPFQKYSLQIQWWWGHRCHPSPSFWCQALSLAASASVQQQLQPGQGPAILNCNLSNKRNNTGKIAKIWIRLWS